MGAATGLGIETLYFDDPHPPLRNRRFDLQGSQKIGSFVELILGKVVSANPVVLGENGIYLGFQLGAHGGGKTRHLEVDSGVVRPDLGAGDPGSVVPERNGIQDVQNRVVAGEPKPPFAIYDELDFFTDNPRRWRGIALMPDDSIWIGDSGNDRIVRLRLKTMARNRITGE